VQALTSLRGIDFVAGVTLVAEIGDFSHFARPRELMGFLGLVPSEYSTGQTRRQAKSPSVVTVTRARVGRSCLELSLSGAHQSSSADPPGGTAQSRARDCLACAAAPRASLSALDRPKLHQNKICVAIARELAGFVWDIARQVTPHCGELIIKHPPTTQHGEANYPSHQRISP